MLRRNLKRMLRYPSMTVMLVAMPVVFLLLFVYVFAARSARGSAGRCTARPAGGPRTPTTWRPRSS